MITFASVCEPSGRQVTATITNRAGVPLTATITTDAKRFTETIEASATAEAAAHLAAGKAMVITIGRDHATYLAPECTSAIPATKPSTADGTSSQTDAGAPAVEPGPAASGLSLAFDRSCDVAGEPVVVHVTNAASAADRVVVAGTAHAVPAKGAVDVPVAGVDTGKAVSVEAGPTRYDYTVPGCPVIAELDAPDDGALGAGLTDAGGGGFNSDLALILAGSAAAALSVAVILAAAARRLRWGQLR